ncbi:MAG: thiamine-phosphate kinase, partial [Rubrivivax sp.]|nr:thiamine-phosphate kinase [Rubrivivax sp.]
ILAGGDEYELCFTAPPERHAEILSIAQRIGLPLACIGIIKDHAGLSVLQAGQTMTIKATGFDHFA